MKAPWDNKFRVTFRILATIFTLIFVTAPLSAQDNPRLRNLNDQLLNVYGRLLDSPAGQAPGLQSQAASLIAERAAGLGSAIESNPAQAVRFAFSEDLLAKLGADLVAYARCTWPSEETAFASFGRVVVSKHYRGTGLGKELVQRSLARLGEESCDIVIGAQLYLEKFYSDFGFVRDGEPYDDVGVPHLRMRLRSRGAPL